MRAYDLIMAKRDGEELSAEAIRWLIDGFTAGEIPDYQIAAFAMAVYFNGMKPVELGALVSSMLHSGDVIEFPNDGRPRIDKHSTGGVGDKMSLPLAPAVAACGVRVPMIAGRGLGHTGGTIDKLEAIPGFQTSRTIEEFKSQVDSIGCCIMSQTLNVAPADKKFYALRDVTATVDCIPLIAASIMSKKIAEGIDGLVLDVKYGNGAFMQTVEQAQNLAQVMVSIGTEMDKRVVARLTSMEQPIGRFVGNAIEVNESIDILKGAGPTDSRALIVELGAEMLVLGEVAQNTEDGRAQISKALDDGSAYEKFKAMVEAQGGDVKSVEQHLPLSGQAYVLEAETAGFIEFPDTRDIGYAALELGGGRKKKSDTIDPGVGFEIYVDAGQKVEAGTPLVKVHHRDGNGLEAAIKLLKEGVLISETPTESPELFGPRIEG